MMDQLDPARLKPRIRWSDAAFAALALALAGYVCVLAVEYYFRVRSVQRHHLESAWMWFVAAAGCMAYAPRRTPAGEGGYEPAAAPRWFPVVFIAGAFALYFPALSIG